jgi:hypothetical protein
MLAHFPNQSPVAIGGSFSVALFLASRRTVVSRHPTLWSPDFPLPAQKHRQRLSSQLPPNINMRSLPIHLLFFTHFFTFAQIRHASRN